jgi:monoamine oxidase
VTRAVVIGAGLAGLAAADALAAAGMEVVALESRDRVGGRVWSRRLENGATVEMGAEFVTAGYELLPALIDRLGLRLAPMGMSFARREPRGGIGVTEAVLNESLRLVEAAIDEGQGAGLSIAALLDRLALDAGARELIECRIQVTYAHETARIAAGAVRDVGHLFREPEAQRVAGGNQQVAERLAAAVTIRLSTAAVRVEQTAAGYRVNGELEADAVVVATPAPDAAGIAFEPALPGWKTSALAAVRYAQAAKLAVPLTDAAPASSVLSVPERFWSWTARDGSGEVAPLVTAFAGSQEALAALEVDRGPHRYLERLAALRPDLALDGASAVLSTWPQGAYSAREPGQPPMLDQELARPVGRIAFAGEHTEPVWYATMEGALRSGRRAAEELLR